MLRAPGRGCLVIADVSGYTGVLVDTELAHAHDALRDLIQTVLSSLRPQFRFGAPRRRSDRGRAGPWLRIVSG